MPDSKLDREDLDALSSLAQHVKQPTRARAEVFLARDWSHYPEVLASGAPAQPAHDLEGLRQDAIRLFEKAVRELIAEQQPTPHRVSPLEVFRDHVLQDHTWESLLAERTELGLKKIRKRALISRQNRALELILEWASGPQVAPEVRPERRNSSRWRIGAYAAVALTLVLALSLFIGNSRKHSSSVLDAVPEGLVGLSYGSTVGWQGEVVAYLARDVEGFEFPQLGAPVETAAVVDAPGLRKRVLALGLGKGGAKAGALVLWDPDRRQLLWELDWQPPLADRKTHPGVLHDDTDHQIYWVRSIANRSSWASLGETLAVVYWSRFSPTFVLFVDLQDGRPIGYYAHPGALYTPMPIDLGNDGQTEVLLSGCDNELGRPVLLALRPTEGKSAASDVLWNTSGHEGALFRVLPPDDRTWLQSCDTERMRVRPLEVTGWNAASRKLVCSVGTAKPDCTAYYLSLTIGGDHIVNTQIAMADAFRRRWRELGVDPDAWMAAANANVLVVGE